MNTGDEVYSTKKEVQFAAVSATGEVEANQVRVCATQDGIRVEMPEAEAIRFSLYTWSGALAKHWPGRGGTVHLLEAADLAVGGYILVIEAQNRRTVKKIVLK